MVDQIPSYYECSCEYLTETTDDHITSETNIPSNLDPSIDTSSPQRHRCEREHERLNRRWTTNRTVEWLKEAIRGRHSNNPHTADTDNNRFLTR